MTDSQYSRLIPLPIETERLLVRAFRPLDDAEAMLSVYSDPEVMKFIPGGALGNSAPETALAPLGRCWSTARRIGAAVASRVPCPAMPPP